MKQCSDCKQTLPYTQFCKKASCKDGYNVRCKRCHTIKYKKSSLKLVVKKIYSTQINNSIKRNHPLPNYTLNELIEWTKNQSNWDSLYKEWVKSDYERMLAPSIDRLDSLKPYSFDNIRLVSWRINQQQSADDKYDATDTRTLRPVRALTLTGELYKEYPSISQAMRDMDTKSAHGIVSVANGIPIKQTNGSTYMPKSYRGLVWQWI